MEPRLRKLTTDDTTRSIGPVRYFDVDLDGAFRIDLLVEKIVVVEVKAVTQRAPGGWRGVLRER